MTSRPRPAASRDRGGAAIPTVPAFGWLTHPALGSALLDLTLRVDVMRWGHAMIAPTPGLMFGEALRRASLPVGRIHFANSDLSGLALLEEAFDHGTRAATEVLRALAPEVRAY